MLFLSSQLFKKGNCTTAQISTYTKLVCLTFTFSAQDQRPPPRITNFLKGNLLNADEVKGGQEYNEQNNGGFKLPCDATGENLKWTWKLNGTLEISTDCGSIFEDRGGSLIGGRLSPRESGNYQCFVKDTVSGKETFSRRVQVLVTCKNLHFT